MNDNIAENQQPSHEGVSIVAIGSFNPAIFQPLWFSGNSLIRPEEATSAKIEIINNDVAVFHTEWFGAQVLSESLTFDTKDPTKARPLRDLVLGTFSILEHTPVRAFGFNSRKHFRMESEEEWHAFGHHYAPKDSWKDVLEQPGMRVLGMLGKRSDSKASAVTVMIQPSNLVHPGVFVHVNQHYDVPKEMQDSQPDHLAFFLTTMRNEWEGFLDYCDRTEKHLLSGYRIEGQ